MSETIKYRDFINVYTSLTEIQRNAGRHLNGKYINSLPIDFTLRIADSLKSNKGKFEIHEETSTTISEKWDMKKNPNGMYEAPYIFKEVNGEKIVDAAAIQERNDAFVTELMELENSPIEMDGIKLPKFTKDELKNSSVEFDNCPNKQYFFEYCVE